VWRGAYGVRVSALDGAIADLYVVFGRYPLVEDVGYCTHCVTPADVAALHAVPLRELTAEELYTYLMHPGTWGDADYYRHFLPRHLELLATDPDMMVVCLSMHLWEPWNRGTDEEAAAIDRFTAAWWPRVAGRESIEWSDRRAAELLDEIGACGRPVAGLFAAWPAGGEADVQFAETVAELAHAAVLATRSVGSGLFARPAEPGLYDQEIAAWLDDPSTRARLVDALAARADERFGRSLDALDRRSDTPTAAPPPARPERLG
jgi:hypothetical protein